MSNNNARIKGLMAKEVSTLGRNDTLDLTDDIIALDRIRRLLVLEDGREGVSQRDLFRSPLAVALGYGERAQKTLLRTIRVKEVMW
jgi:hypothetical protein